MRLCSTTESRDAKWTFMTVPKSFCCSSVRTNNSRNTLLASSCLKRWRPELNEDGEPFAAYVRSEVLWVKQHNPLCTTGAICIQLSYIKHAVPDRVKSSFVIFDIRTLWRSGLSVRVPGCQRWAYKSGWEFNDFIILTSGHSDAQDWASECPDVKNYKRRSDMAQDAL